MPENVILMKEKKFLWDRIEYPSLEKMLEAMNGYKANGFETETSEESGKTYLYTRRVVKEVIVAT